MLCYGPVLTLFLWRFWVSMRQMFFLSRLLIDEQCTCQCFCIEEIWRRYDLEMRTDMSTGLAPKLWFEHVLRACNMHTRKYRDPGVSQVHFRKHRKRVNKPKHHACQNRDALITLLQLSTLLRKLGDTHKTCQNATKTFSQLPTSMHGFLNPNCLCRIFSQR